MFSLNQKNWLLFQHFFQFLNRKFPPKVSRYHLAFFSLSKIGKLTVYFFAAISVFFSFLFSLFSFLYQLSTVNCQPSTINFFLFSNLFWAPFPALTTRFPAPAVAGRAQTGRSIRGANPASPKTSSSNQNFHAPASTLF